MVIRSQRRQADISHNIIIIYNQSEELLPAWTRVEDDYNIVTYFDLLRSIIKDVIYD